MLICASFLPTLGNLLVLQGTKCTHRLSESAEIRARARIHLGLTPEPKHFPHPARPGLHSPLKEGQASPGDAQSRGKQGSPRQWL